MRHRCLWVLLALSGVLTLAPATLAKSAARAANPGQAFFHDALIADSKTTSAIRDALKAKTAIVDPVITYADLTGDSKSDAVVRVHSTGAAGVIAVYVFSTDGNSKGTLRAVFRSQRLFRAVTAVTAANLRIDTADYKAGDELCCPSELTRRIYTWSAKAHEFRRTSLTTVKNP